VAFVTQKKILEAAHHKFQRRIPWAFFGGKNKVRNEEIIKKTALQKLKLLIEQERRLTVVRNFGHVLWLDDGRLRRQGMRT